MAEKYTLNVFVMEINILKITVKFLFMSGEFIRSQDYVFATNL